MPTIIEICAANLESALAAQEGKAHRIELCSALEVGGLTPSAGLVRAAVAALSIPVCVLIRPRAGHFTFQKAEVDLMCDDIRFCREEGAAGVVIGALTDAFDLDIAALQAMKAAAGDMEVICHRAFDFVNNPEQALEQLIELGFHRVLTSGREASVWDGREQVAHYLQLAAGRITVMPGSGVTVNNIVALKAATGATEFHLTAKKTVDLKNNPGLPGLETAYQVSDVATIVRTVASV